MATINTQFKPNIPYLFEISYSPKDSTDRPEIRNINITNGSNETDTDLIGHIENAYIGNGDTTPSATFTLTYTGAQKTFTSNINFVIDGITNYENGLNVPPIICNGTLELKPLYFHNVSNTPKTIKLSASASGSFGNNLNIDYCISTDEPDENSWTNLSNVTIEPVYRTVQSFTIPAGKSLWVRSNQMSTWYYESNYFYFNSTDNGGIELGGNIMSLINSSTMPNYCFYRLFYSLKALSAIKSDFTLPVNLSDYCYQNMFNGCTSLTTVPTDLLSATTLKYACYNGMFSNCTSLTNTPSLPATTLKQYCYQDMFYGCTSLTSAPALPATTLASSCYTQMFNGCTSLTSAPALPATTLTSNCYQNMFYGCTSLTTAPSLPATTLANSCYNGMFRDCSNLTNIPATLPATTLAPYCYQSMFNGCHNITTAPALPATTLASNCYNSMFISCSALVTAPSLPAITLTDNCYQEMFRGCSALVNAPATLPATTLARYCYRGMFYGCESLTTAPTLPATTLVDYCYVEMFRECYNLNNITMLATNIANNCFDDWVSGVSSSGTFTKDANTTLPSGNSGIPNGWTVQDYNA